MAKDTTADSKATDKPAKASKSATGPKPGPFERLATYLRDVRGEMTRVVWPNRPEVLNSSVVVITTLAFFILFITIIDYVVVIPIITAITKIHVGG